MINQDYTPIVLDINLIKHYPIKSHYSVIKKLKFGIDMERTIKLNYI